MILYSFFAEDGMHLSMTAFVITSASLWAFPRVSYKKFRTVKILGFFTHTRFFARQKVGKKGIVVGRQPSDHQFGCCRITDQPQSCAGVYIKSECLEMEPWRWPSVASFNVLTKSCVGLEVRGDRVASASVNAESLVIMLCSIQTAHPDHDWSFRSCLGRSIASQRKLRMRDLNASISPTD